MMEFYKLDASPSHGPVIELIVRAPDDIAARITARQFVKVLAKAGYDRFELWDMRPGDLLAQRVCRYSVTRRHDDVVEDYVNDKGVRHCGVI